jgi:hypothetical protein
MREVGKAKHTTLQIKIEITFCILAWHILWITFSENCQWVDARSIRYKVMHDKVPINEQLNNMN